MADTTTSEVDDLAQTLYDALVDEDPRVAPLFGHDVNIFRPVLSTVLAEVAAQRWIKNQLDQTGIRAIDFRNGARMDIAMARDLAAHWVAAARELLGDGPNYSETKVEMDGKLAESPEMYTVVIQRHTPGALTPHEARQKAEARISAAQAVLDEYEGSDWWHTIPATRVREALTGKQADA